MILANRIRCKHCGDLICSLNRHDYKSCSCGTIAVDGGTSYLKRAFKNTPEIDYEELSIIVDDKEVK